MLLAKIWLSNLSKKVTQSLVHLVGEVDLLVIPHSSSLATTTLCNPHNYDLTITLWGPIFIY